MRLFYWLDLWITLLLFAPMSNWHLNEQMLMSLHTLCVIHDVWVYVWVCVFWWPVKGSDCGENSLLISLWRNSMNSWRNSRYCQSLTQHFVHLTHVCTWAVCVWRVGGLTTLSSERTPCSSVCTPQSHRIVCVVLIALWWNPAAFSH